MIHPLNTDVLNPWSLEKTTTTVLLWNDLYTGRKVYVVLNIIPDKPSALCPLLLYLEKKNTPLLLKQSSISRESNNFVVCWNSWFNQQPPHQSQQSSRGKKESLPVSVWYCMICIFGICVRQRGNELPMFLHNRYRGSVPEHIHTKHSREGIHTSIGVRECTCSKKILLRQSIVLAIMKCRLIKLLLILVYLKRFLVTYQFILVQLRHWSRGNLHSVFVNEC